MASTPYADLLKSARYQNNAAKGDLAMGNFTPDTFWSDDELFGYAKRGTTDLWGAYIDLHQEHYLTIDETHVSLASGATSLTGVPLDTFRVYLIEPLDPTTNACCFVPRPYNHIEFINARAQSSSASFSPTSGVNIFYCLQGVGAPNSAPTVLIGPSVNALVTVRFAYVPVLGVQNYVLASATNPIPGESDNAIIAWIIAYMRAKERDDHSPDPAWLAVYSTEKQSLLTRSAPRQEQDAQYVDGMFDSYWR